MGRPLGQHYLCVLPREGPGGAHLLLHFSCLSEILLRHLYFACFYAAIKLSQSFFLVYHTFRCYSEEHSYALRWGSFRKFSYVEKMARAFLISVLFSVRVTVKLFLIGFWVMVVFFQENF